MNAVNCYELMEIFFVAQLLRLYSLHRRCWFSVFNDCSGEDHTRQNDYSANFASVQQPVPSI